MNKSTNKNFFQIHKSRHRAKNLLKCVIQDLNLKWITEKENPMQIWIQNNLKQRRETAIIAMLHLLKNQTLMNIYKANTHMISKTIVTNVNWDLQERTDFLHIS